MANLRRLRVRLGSLLTFPYARRNPIVDRALALETWCEFRNTTIPGRETPP